MEKMLDKYAATVRAKDVDAFVGLYADDVRTFDLWSVWSYDGKDAFRGMVAEWFGSLGDDVVAVEYDEVRTQAGEDVGGLSAFLTYRGLSAEGEELRGRPHAIVERAPGGLGSRQPDEALRVRYVVADFYAQGFGFRSRRGADVHPESGLSGCLRRHRTARGKADRIGPQEERRGPVGDADARSAGLVARRRRRPESPSLHQGPVLVRAEFRSRA